MGFFNWFKKKDVTKEEVELDKFELWIKDNFKGLEKFDKLKEKIKKSVEEAKSNVDLLKDIKFQKNADERLKNQVIDNREAYTRQINLFLKKVSGLKINYENFDDWHPYFDEELKRLNKSTSKSFYIIQTLFRDKISKIATNLRDVSHSLKKLNELIKGDEFNLYFSSLNEISDLKKEIFETQRLGREVKHNESFLKKCREVLNKLEKNKSNFLNSDKYKRLQRVKEEKIKKEEELRRLKSEVIELFSPIEKSLRKSQKLGSSKILNAYVNSSLSLFGDGELEILKELEIIKNSILKHKLDLDDRKRKKTLEGLGIINKDLLRDLQKRYNEINLKISKLDEHIGGDDTNKVLFDLENEIESQKLKIKNLEEDLARFKEKSSYSNYKVVLVSIQSKISKLLNKDVIVKI